MMKDDVESGDNEPLLAPKGKEAPAVPGEGGPPYSPPKADMKEAAFWLFMLFIASVVMTVGNKVCYCFCHLSNNQLGIFFPAVAHPSPSLSSKQNCSTTNAYHSMS